MTDGDDIGILILGPDYKDDDNYDIEVILFCSLFELLCFARELIETFLQVFSLFSNGVSASVLSFATHSVFSFKIICKVVAWITDKKYNIGPIESRAYMELSVPQISSWNH